MADTIIHNPIMSEIKTSLNHILHSLTELSARINKPPHTSSAQLINTPAPLSLPTPSNPITPSPLVPSNPTLPSYPVKRLTYSEMQQLRDHGLCLNCSGIDTPSHRCPVKRIILVLRDEDPNIEQQSMDIHGAPTVQQQFSSQEISLHASDLKNSIVPIKYSVHYQSEVDYSRVALVKALCATGDSSRHIEQRENGAHDLFVEINKLEQKWIGAHIVFVEMNKLKFESKILIFDPGGTFNIEGIFDLEDKVVFKGSVMIGKQYSPSTIAARPNAQECLN